MNLPLVDQQGHPYSLERQLASGGEGAVFTLVNDPHSVAKVYHKPSSTQTVEKLVAMVALANPNLLALAAWPSSLLLNARTRQVTGFIMPRLIDCQPIQQLYNPVQRLKSFPRAGWTFQIRAARNLAASFDEVHKAGCLVGDVNQSNAQVSSQALVRLIDCDSFQVRANGKLYECEVGVPHYTPPELQGKSFRGLVRTENHDRFGLAVLIYQLLFVGRHPYAGVYRGSGDPSFEQLITEYRFAQGPMAPSWGMEPPPYTPTFDDIPASVGFLFRRAFERGSENGSRPRATEWVSALTQLEQECVECTADSGHKYWRGARGCVWCRLAGNGGPEYYFGVAAGVGTFAVDEAKLQEVLRRLNACRPLDFPCDRRKFGPSATPEPKPLPEGMQDNRSMSLVILITFCCCLLMLPVGVIHGAISVIGLLGATVFGVWFAVLRMLSPWQQEYRRRRKYRDEALDELKQLEVRWSRRVRAYQQDHAETSQNIHDLVKDCRGLAFQHQKELQRLTASAEAAARLRHLRLHSLADADIPKIGAGRKQILAAHLIFTAADIEETRIRNIKGFGDVLTNNLLDWKHWVLQQFRFDPATGVSPAEQRSLTVKYRNQQQQILSELDRQLTALESLAPACRLLLQQMVPSLRRALAVSEQAAADLDFMAERR
jgi:DNA-binding helix-hairpin-helix protein with protein kinase domain